MIEALKLWATGVIVERMEKYEMSLIFPVLEHMKMEPNRI